MIAKELGEINARKEEIRAELESPEANLDALENELRELNEKETQIQKRKEMLDSIGSVAEPSVVENPIVSERKGDVQVEYREAFFKSLMGKELTEGEKRSIAATNVAGAVPTTTSQQIITKLKQTVPLLNEVTLLHVPGNVTFAVEGTRNTAGLHTESGETSAGADTLVTISLAGYEILKIVRISATVKNMTIDAFESFLVDNLVRSVSEKIEDYLVNGDGSDKPKGVAYANTWTDNTNAIDWASTALAAVDITEAIGLLGSGYDRNAKMLMSKKTLWTNVMPIRDDAKAPICRDDGNGNYFIYGYPVILSDAVDAGDIYIGDFTKIVANLADEIKVSASEHSGFTYNAIDYRGTCIFDSDVADAAAFVKIAADIA